MVTRNQSSRERRPTRKVTLLVSPRGAQPSPVAPKTGKVTLLVSPRGAQPPAVAPKKTGKDNASPTLDGLETGNNLHAQRKSPSLERHPTRKVTLIVSPRLEQPPPVVPKNTGKDNPSPTIDGLETGNNRNTLSTARSSGSKHVVINPSTSRTTGRGGRLVQKTLLPPVASSSSKVPLAPVTKKGQAATASLADALGFAFTENALHTEPQDPPPEPRRTFLLPSTMPMKVTSDTSSMQTRPRTEPRQAYIRRSKVLQEYVEKGTGRTLDQDELEDLLSANVVNRVAYDKATGVKVSDHARRSNLRHLLGATTLLNQPEMAGGLPGGGAEEDPMHVPPSFAKCTVSREDQFLQMLEQTFGPDSRWGGGPKPKAVSSVSLRTVHVFGILMSSILGREVCFR